MSKLWFQSGKFDLNPEKAWYSPAKINLFLHVLGRRSDGYHELQTVFHFLEYCDQLFFESFSHTNAIEVVLQSSVRIPLEQNLVYRAAQALQQYSQTKQGARITLQKKIPMGGGLGGGSSNAATALVALNELWGLGYSKSELQALGLKLGADVPVFILGESAFAQGVGEILEPYPLQESWYVLMFPPCQVSTAEIFKSPALTRNTTPCKMCDLPLPFSEPRDVLALGRNDCESVVSSAYEPVAFALEWLSQFGVARMTGSGGTVFLPCETVEEANAVLQEMPQPFSGVVAKGRNRSPLYD